jgi:AAHS family 4-hydroxybenzoate transporter-like MFS transporter
MTQEEEFDVNAFLERQQIGRVQLTVLGICMLAMLVDGYDVYVMAFMLPAIAKDFGVSPGEMAPILFFQQIGLIAGSLLVSPLADRFGRKTILMVSAGCFGVFTLLCTGAHSVMSLAALRFLAGLFLSGVVPNTIALTSEVAPSRARATMVTIMFCGFTFGTACGGYLATLMLGPYGWQGAFWSGGLIPLAMLPLFWFVLPESLQFRVSRNDRDPRIALLLRRLDPALRLTGNPRFRLQEAHVSGAPVAALFRDGRAPTTLLLWFAFAMSLLAINLTAAWSPTFFTTYSTMSLQEAAAIGVVMAAAGIVAMLFYGAILDRYGRTRVLTLTYALGALAVGSIGFLQWFSWTFYLAVVVEGACVIGAQSGLNALSAVIYPTRMRATGVGWAFGAGRVGAILGPVIAHFVLAHHWAVSSVFLACAAPTLLVALGTFMVGFGSEGHGEPVSEAPAPDCATPRKSL